MSASSIRRVATGTVVPIEQAKSSGRRAKRRYTKVADDTRARVVDRLIRKYRVNGGLTKKDYQAEADTCGVSASAVEKWVREARRAAAGDEVPTAVPRSTRTSQVVITDDVLLQLDGTSLMSGYLECLGEGLIPEVHYSTFERAYKKQVAPDIRAALRHGEKVLPEYWVYVQAPDNPLMNMVTIDLFFPRVRCVDDVTGEPVRPVWAMVRERASGCPMAWHLFRGSVTPGDVDADGEPKPRVDARAILALLGSAFLGWERHGVRVGGIPVRLRCDREALFLTPENRAYLAGLAVAVDPTNSYSSWENGAHERPHETLREEVLNRLPASTRGPKDKTGTPHYPDATITFSELEALLDRWAWSYALERTNTAIGMTPFEYWTQRIEAGDEIQFADRGLLAELALPGEKTYKRGKEGVLDPNGHHYIDAALMDHSRSAFRLSRWPGRDDIREAFDAATGEWVCTVYRRKDAPAQKREEILERRGRASRTVAGLRAEAERRRRVREGGTPTGTPADGATDPGTSTEPGTGTPPAALPTQKHDDEPTTHADDVSGPAEAPMGAAARYEATAQHTQYRKDA